MLYKEVWKKLWSRIHADSFPFKVFFSDRDWNKNWWTDTKKKRKKKRCTWSQGHWSRHVQIKSSRQLTMLENNCLMLKLFIFYFDKIKELTQLGLIRTWHHTMYALVFYCKDNKDNNSVITYHGGGSQLNFPQPPPSPMRLYSVLMIPYDWQSIFSEFPLLVEKPAPSPFPLVPSWNHVIPQKILINNDCPIKKKIFSYMHLLFLF